MIGTKMARLKNLVGKEAKCESLDDTLDDLRNYILILKAYREANE